MAQQIRGIIIEGQSCSGKTSLMDAIRRSHPNQPDAERSTIFLSEHYSQNLNYINGTLKNLSQEENLKALHDRIDMLEQLSSYADSMGLHSRRSRGIFYVFERFHLNYARCFGNQTPEYQLLEKRLAALNPQTILCTISPSQLSPRLAHRAQTTNRPQEENSCRQCSQYHQIQNQMITLAQASRLPTTILCTDTMDWECYAQKILLPK